MNGLALISSLYIPALSIVCLASSALSSSAATIKTLVSPTNAAYATGAGVYASGAPVTVTAVVTNDCYYFLRWTRGGITVSTNPAYSFTATNNATLVAAFARQRYHIQTANQPVNGGTNSGAGIKACGTMVTVSAYPKPGFRFVSWTQGADVLSSNATYRFTATADAVLTANYQDVAPPTVVVVSPASGSTTTSNTATISGKAVDKVSMAGVFYNPSASGWTLAETTNGWTNWSATVPLQSGTNLVQYYASDTSGNSTTVKTLAIVKLPVSKKFLVANAGITHPQAHVAFDGTNYLVAFQTHPSGSGTPTAQLIAADETLIASQLQIPVQGGADPPCVAFDGQNYLMTWADPANQIEGGGVHGQFVTTSGDALGDRFAISQSTSIDSYNTLVFGGGVYFVMWSDSGTDPDAIYGAMLTPSGDISVPDFEISPNGSQVEAGQAAAAFDGTNFLATWSRATGHASVMGRLIAPDGTFATDPFVIYTNAATAGKTLNCVVFDGTRYLVLFTPGLSPAMNPAASHILGRFVSTSGEVLTNRIVITRSVGPQVLPGAAFDGNHYPITWNQGLNPFSSTILSSQIKARLFDADCNPVVPEFTLFAQAGGLIPLWAPVLFDGSRFLAVTGYGQLVSPAPNLKFTNGSIRGAFVSP